MKFAPVVISSVVQLTLQVRPAFVSEISSSTGDDTECGYSRNADTLANNCKKAGMKPEHGIQDCFGYYCTSHTCTVKCCSGETKLKDGKCKCIGESGSYAHTTSNSCCAESADGEYNKIYTDSRCGCSEVGSTPRHGAEAKDCCSEQMSGKKCVLRTCKAPGKTFSKEDECCRGMVKTVNDGWTSRTHKKYTEGGKCDCVPPGISPSDWDNGGKATCCSGTVTASGVCGCINSKKNALAKGNAQKSCCNKEGLGGADTHKNGDDVFCKSDTCKAVGETSSGGDACCSGKKDSKNVCQCLYPGKKAEGGAVNCCSGVQDADGKCAPVRVGETPHPSDADLCVSKRLDKKGRCACFQDGDKSDVEGECCSTKYGDKAAKTCGCLPNGWTLRNGAWKKDCCSKRASEGVCVCSDPGAPMRAGNNGQECCAGYAEKDHCGCFGKNHSTTESTIHHCCGGFHNESSHKCACIPTGYMIAPFVTKEHCCSNNIKDETCAASASLAAENEDDDDDEAEHKGEGKGRRRR